MKSIFTLALIFVSIDAMAVDPPVVPELEFDLRSRQIPTVALPFEQRFNIRAKVDGEVEEAVGYYMLRGKDACEPLPPLPEKRESNCPEVTESGSATCMGESQAFGEGASRAVLFSVVEPLQVSKDYCFWFQLTRSMSEKELKKFNERAPGAIDTFFRNVVGKPTKLPKKNLEQLRDSILAQLQTVAPKGTKPAPEIGSIFHPDSIDVLDREFTKPIGEILAAQLTRDTDLAAYCHERSDNATELRDALRNPKLIETLDALEEKKTQEAIRKRLAAFPQATTALTLLTDATLTIAVRDDPLCHQDAPSPLLLNSWKPGDLTDAATMWRQHLRAVEDLQSVLAEIAREPQLLTILNVTKPTVDEAVTQLDVAVKTVAEIEARLDKIAGRLQQRSGGIARLIEQAGQKVQSTVPLLSTTIGTFTTRHNWYVSMDVGLGHAPELDKTFTYAGMNVYLRPINKEVPLEGFEFKKRFSLMLGLTLQKIERAGAFESVINDRAVVLGAGFRVLDSVRLSGGAVVIREKDPNPNVTTTETAISPFISISLDWDVRSTFRSLGTALNIPD